MLFVLRSHPSQCGVIHTENLSFACIIVEHNEIIDGGKEEKTIDTGIPCSTLVQRSLPAFIILLTGLHMRWAKTDADKRKHLV